MERFSRRFQYRNQKYRAEFVRRPFREGLEVSVTLSDGTVLRVAELGLGEKALIAKLKVLIGRKLVHPNT